MAAHSPVMVDYGWRRGTVVLLDWASKRCDRIEARALPSATSYTRVLDSSAQLSGKLSDMLYAENVVFVEDQSDGGALELLLQDVNPEAGSVSFVGLKITDKMFKKSADLAHVLPIIVRSRASALLPCGAIILDADKLKAVEAYSSKTAAEDDPFRQMHVAFAGVPGNDIESCFCHEKFMAAFLLERRGEEFTTDALLLAIREAFKRLVNSSKSAVPKVGKGSHVLRHLLLSVNDELGAASKGQILRSLVAYYLKHKSSEFSKPVCASLEPVLKVLRALL
jgi:hypothetical protein